MRVRIFTTQFSYIPPQRLLSILLRLGSRRQPLPKFYTLLRIHTPPSLPFATGLSPDILHPSDLLRVPVVQFQPIYKTKPTPVRSANSTHTSTELEHERMATVSTPTSNWLKSPIVHPLSTTWTGSVTGSRCRIHCPVRASSHLYACASELVERPEPIPVSSFLRESKKEDTPYMSADPIHEALKRSHITISFLSPKRKRAREWTNQRPTESVSQPTEVEPKMMAHPGRRTPIDILGAVERFKARDRVRHDEERLPYMKETHSVDDPLS